MKFKNHKEFFDRAGDERVLTRFYCESRAEVTVEELYQHFKARFIEERNEAFRELADAAGFRLKNPEEVENAARK